jgi:general secretion pathway protein G
MLTLSPSLRRRLRAKAGFTLLEILIVITIIGLLVTLVGAGLMKQLDNSKVNAAAIQMRGFKAALDSMNLAIGRYPTEAEGLDLLVKDPGDAAPGWNGPYLDKDEVPLDPWKHPYRYIAPEGAEAPKVMSLGNDGQEGGTKNAADIVL